MSSAKRLRAVNQLPLAELQREIVRLSVGILSGEAVIDLRRPSVFIPAADGH
jgi:hypothetical protein